MLKNDGEGNFEQRRFYNAVPENLILDKVTELEKVARSSDEILGDGSAVRLISFLYIYFGGLKCAGHSFAYFVFFEKCLDCRIAGSATNLATHLPKVD